MKKRLKHLVSIVQPSGSLPARWRRSTLLFGAAPRPTPFPDFSEGPDPLSNYKSVNESNVLWIGTLTRARAFSSLELMRFFLLLVVLLAIVSPQHLWARTARDSDEAARLSEAVADLVATPHPEYPEQARRDYLQGKGLYLVRFDSDTGRTREVTVSAPAAMLS